MEGEGIRKNSPRICAPLMAESIDQMLIDTSEAKSRGVDLVEVRLDCSSILVWTSKHPSQTVSFAHSFHLQSEFACFTHKDIGEERPNHLMESLVSSIVSSHFWTESKNCSGDPNLIRILCKIQNSKTERKAKNFMYFELQEKIYPSQLSLTTALANPSSIAAAPNPFCEYREDKGYTNGIILDDVHLSQVLNYGL